MMPLGLALVVAGLLAAPADCQGPLQVPPRGAAGIVPAMPVVATEPVVVEERYGFKLMEFTLTNSSERTVIAWSVRVEARYADGQYIGNIRTEDGYREYEGLPTDHPVVIRAGESIRTRVELGRHVGHPEPLVGARVTVLGVLPLDGAHLDVFGSMVPSVCGEVRETRRQRFDGWSAVLDALEGMDSALAGRRRLAAALDAIERKKRGRFPAGTGTVAGHEIERAILTDVEAALRTALFASPDPPPPDRVVRETAEKARAEATAARAHLLWDCRMSGDSRRKH